MHAREPAHEKGRNQVQNLVLGFKPGNEVILAAGYFAETDERLHFVQVAADGFLQYPGPVHILVQRVAEQAFLTVGQAP